MKHFSFSILKSNHPPCFNQAKNIPVVLPSSMIKIWGKLFEGSWVIIVKINSQTWPVMIEKGWEIQKTVSPLKFPEELLSSFYRSSPHHPLHPLHSRPLGPRQTWWSCQHSFFFELSVIHLSSYKRESTNTLRLWKILIFSLVFNETWWIMHEQQQENGNVKIFAADIN